MLKLDAVNDLLDAINLPAATALGSNPDATAAEAKLDRVSEEVQGTGWNTNTDVGITITPDINGYITFPSNLLVADLGNYNAGFRHTSVRKHPTTGAWQLYDLRHATYVFSLPIKADLITLLDFDHLTLALQRYIAARAAREYQRSKLGAAAVDKFRIEHEQETFAALTDQEGAADNLNVLTGNAHCLRITHRYNSFFGR